MLFVDILLIYFPYHLQRYCKSSAEQNIKCNFNIFYAEMQRAMLQRLEKNPCLQKKSKKICICEYKVLLLQPKIKNIS